MALVFSFSCTGDPLLTELKTNDLEVIIKGTYESNTPRPWLSPSSANLTSKSITMHPVTNTSLPSTFMIDITGMTLTGDKTAEFGHYRVTYSCPTNDSASFFNGTGITMKNDDVPSGKNYDNINLYLRKILFSDAQRYNLSSVGWENGIDFITYFEEVKVNAFNFNLPLVQYFYDTLREDDSVNRVYPLRIRISNGLNFNRKEKTVLEIRLVIKNFIKLYEYNSLDYPSDKPYIVHYFGVSDWLREVKPGENLAGGNLLAVARTYVKGQTGRVFGASNTGARYIIGIPANEDIDDYTMPPLTKATLRDNEIGYSTIPTLPIETSESVPAKLMYYMQLEKFKSDWNKFINTVPGADRDAKQQFFEDEWTRYNGLAGNFKIPPIATYCPDGVTTYEITNIAPGDYKFYYAAVEPVWGTLFRYGEFLPLEGETAIPIDIGENKEINIP
ncbi:MAG: hypothetical protein FWG13_04895 [Leptospirales bacterium]|nr:hypothetical protein [Leptospirales bacterium]